MTPFAAEGVRGPIRRSPGPPTISGAATLVCVGVGTNSVTVGDEVVKSAMAGSFLPSVGRANLCWGLAAVRVRNLERKERLLQQREKEREEFN